MESTVAPINREAVVSEEVRWQRTCKVAAVGSRVLLTEQEALTAGLR
jgi:hypothetical protein